ncbi:hypothetical protein OUZ56_000702 [Daphnia magna]|uniref:Uncharacterized protein n=1 Tax=Daphnia magna TaxID=35525 RepID=A0ABR0A0J5_9CRUS|nr:hypothetical protein OUZ56_000702 [Daphnia magna]
MSSAFPPPTAATGLSALAIISSRFVRLAPEFSSVMLTSYRSSKSFLPYNKSKRPLGNETGQARPLKVELRNDIKIIPPNE